MKVATTDAPIAMVDADVAVVGHYEESGLQEAAVEADKVSEGLLSRLLASKEITGKHAELTPLLGTARIQARQLLVVGLGKQDAFGVGEACRAAGAAAKHLASKPRNRVAVYFGTLDQAALEGAVCGAMTGCQGQDLFRSEKNLHPFAEMSWAHAEPAAVQQGSVLGQAVNLTRRLVNLPPDQMYPEAFAASAERVAGEHDMQVEVWDQQRLEAERCQALLAVGRGSARPPRLVILKYRGGADDQPTLGLVGKGVTFDSGGLSLKPSDSMKTMKSDMAGAATVLGAMQAIAQLRLPVNVTGLVGLVENLVSGNSYKLGDILTARSGKTIEVLNTDAEGRLVLADVLDVACGQGVEKIVDLATLTGACVVALGRNVAGLMTNEQTWCDLVAEAARHCGERAWQLPMFPEYGKEIQSPIADIKNIGEGRWGGAITAAKFLEEFVADKPWTHMDIAGPSFLESPKPWLDSGASGAFVRTLVEVARRWPDR